MFNIFSGCEYSIFLENVKDYHIWRLGQGMSLHPKRDERSYLDLVGRFSKYFYREGGETYIKIHLDCIESHSLDLISSGSDSSNVDKSLPPAEQSVDEETVVSKSISGPTLIDALPSTEQTELKVTTVDVCAPNGKEVHESDLRVPVVVLSSAEEEDVERVLSTPELLDTLVDGRSSVEMVLPQSVSVTHEINDAPSTKIPSTQQLSSLPELELMDISQYLSSNVEQGGACFNLVRFLEGEDGENLNVEAEDLLQTPHTISPTSIFPKRLEKRKSDSFECSSSRPTKMKKVCDNNNRFPLLQGKLNHPNTELPTPSSRREGTRQGVKRICTKDTDDVDFVPQKKIFRITQSFANGQKVTTREPLHTINASDLYSNEEGEKISSAPSSLRSESNSRKELNDDDSVDDFVSPLKKHNTCHSGAANRNKSGSVKTKPTSTNKKIVNVRNNYGKLQAMAAHYQSFLGVGQVLPKRT